MYPRSLEQRWQSHAGLPCVLDAAPVTSRVSCNWSWGAAQKQPPPSAGYFRDTSMTAVAKLSISSFLFGNRPGAGGNAPLGVQQLPGGLATEQALCPGGVRALPWLPAPISIFISTSISISILPGELEPAGPASGLKKQGLMLSGKHGDGSASLGKRCKPQPRRGELPPRSLK